MSGALKVAIKKAKFVSARLARQVVQRVDPEERGFRRVWPFIESIDGFLVSPVQERWLFRTARALPDGATIVEIGSFKGRSTCSLAYGCRGTNKHVYAIDTFSGNDVDFRPREVLLGGRKEGSCAPLSHDGDFFDDFLNNITKCGLTAYVTPIRGRSSEVGKTWDRPIHLLFIDGSHQYEDVLKDFEIFYPHVAPGGIIAFHDVVHTWPGPLKVWEEVASRILSEAGRCSTIAFGKKRL